MTNFIVDDGIKRVLNIYTLLSLIICLLNLNLTNVLDRETDTQTDISHYRIVTDTHTSLYRVNCYFDFPV